VWSRDLFDERLNPPSQRGLLDEPQDLFEDRIAGVALDDVSQSARVLDGELDLEGAAPAAQVDYQVGPAVAHPSVVIDVDAPALVAAAFGLAALALGEHASPRRRRVQLEFYGETNDGELVPTLRVRARRL